MSRFLVQWLSSERLKRSVIPKSFWYFSIAGSLVLLTYSIHRSEPVFGFGQAAGLLIYARNLQLIRNAATAKPTAPEVPAQTLRIADHGHSATAA